jgi:hypothetical protein
MSEKLKKYVFVSKHYVTAYSLEEANEDRNSDEGYMIFPSEMDFLKTTKPSDMDIEMYEDWQKELEEFEE